jgi:hypothetical protein
MPRGNPANTQFGPGTLRWAPLGTAEPASLTGAWPSGWTQVGYTLAGSEVRTNPTTTDLDVEEENETLGSPTTKMTREVMFNMAEVTLANLALSENSPGSSIVTTDPAFDSFEPPNVGEEVHFMLGWDSEDAKRRRFWRECKQTGQMTETHKKGALAGFSATFRAFKPQTGAKSYKEFRAKAA